MPDLVADYAIREKVEQQLLEKLSHRRLYLTTIDGGGGFGKTELAKKVVWNSIESEDRSEFPLSLQFKYVV